MATSGVSTTGSFTSKSRLTGLSGLDTEQMVKDTMKAQRIPLDKIKQRRDRAEWKRDAYRDMTTLLRGLKSDFFDVVKPANNMLSKNTYMKFSGTSTDSTVVTVSGSSGSAAGSHTVSVYNLATADKAVSGSTVTKPLTGNAISAYNLSGRTINITLDGVTREIALDNYSYTAGSPATSDIVSKAGTGLQALLDKAFGTGKITASYDGNTGGLSFATANGASSMRISSGSNASSDAVSLLGFSPGASNRINTGSSLEALSSSFATPLTFDANGKLKFTINSKSFEFDKSTSLASMMSTVNSDETAGVNLSYDETTDKFTMTSKRLGDGDNIVISNQGGNFFGAAGASGIGTGSAATEQGKDAKVKIDGQILVRGANSFAVNGVTYNLLKAHENPDTKSETVGLSMDVDSVYNNIKNFVDKYNDIIDKINKKIDEKYDRNYQPLTDAQKEGMKDEDIKKWEEKAKTGLLRNDSILENTISEMRRALSEAVQGVDSNLSSIGITTGTYSEKGKLNIDEAKLKAAIKQNPEKVMNLFSKESSSVPSNNNLTSDQNAVRYKEEGLAYRISDILDKNIRTTNGKGLLLLQAGIQGDATEFKNDIYNELKDYNTKIKDMTDRLADKETALYKKYSALETYIQKMNAQSSWLSQQFGSKS